VADTITIASVKRLNNSHNGNPRFDIVMSDGTIARTEADSSLSYSVENVFNGKIPFTPTYANRQNRLYVTEMRDANGKRL
jgi:hypothetical protein